jgi:pimeloyl-ACP methyl ester carboxylesterase
MSERKINLGHDDGAKSGPLTAYAGAEPPSPRWFFHTIAKAPEQLTATTPDGIRLNVLRWGKRENPGLVLIHGNGAHAWWWAFIAPYLAEDYNVAAFDLSGMGDSQWRDSYAMRVFADEPIAVAEACGMFEHEEPPVVVGHSFGGFVTMLCGAKHGARLAGTILVDSPVTPPDRPHGPPVRAMRPHRVYPTLTAALARFRLAPEQKCENDYLIDYVARRSLKEVEGGWTWKFDPAIWQRFESGDTAAALRAISCRVGILRGDRSILMPPEIGAYMFELLGKAVPVVGIPQARHHVMLDQPLAVVTALRALLADWNHSRPNRRV